MRVGRVLLAAGVLALAAACTGSREAAERREEVERARAAMEGAQPGAPATPGGEREPVRVTRGTEGAVSGAPEPPTPEATAWAAALGRSLDTLDRRSRQALSVHRLRGTNDPRQKTQELMAFMQWCDEGALEACLHVGHVLVFNECLLDRGRGFYQKAARLAEALPAPAVDSFPVDGQPQRQELRSGLQFSDPGRRDDQQVQSLLSVCGAIAARDAPLWDAFFAAQAAGETTPAAEPASPDERLALGVMRKKLLLEADERIAALAHLHDGLARDVRARLGGVAMEMCAGGDPAACATASFIHARRCDFPAMEDAYNHFEAIVAGLDSAGRAQAQELARDVIGPARSYAGGDPKMRDLLRRSFCGGR